MGVFTSAVYIIFVVSVVAVFGAFFILLGSPAAKVGMSLTAVSENYVPVQPKVSRQRKVRSRTITKTTRQQNWQPAKPSSNPYKDFNWRGYGRQPRVRIPRYMRLNQRSRSQGMTFA
jgi:hypothetical protein